MEINSLNKLNLEKYIKIKMQAYNLSDAYDKKAIIEMASKYEIDNPEERLIYISTLLYPNDAEIIKAFSKKQKREDLLEELKIPDIIIEAKIYEYSKYNLPKILEKNESLKQYSNFKTKFKDDPTTEDIINSRFK